MEEMDGKPGAGQTEVPEVLEEDTALLVVHSASTAPLTSLDAGDAAPGHYALVNGRTHRVEYQRLLGSRLVVCGGGSHLCNTAVVLVPVEVCSCPWHAGEQEE